MITTVPKQTFRKLATAFAGTRPPSRDASAQHQWRIDRHMVVKILADANPRFDSARFIALTEVDEQ